VGEGLRLATVYNLSENEPGLSEDFEKIDDLFKRDAQKNVAIYSVG